MNPAGDRLRVVISEALNSSLSLLGADLEVVEEADLWSRPVDLRLAVERAAGLVVRNQTSVDRPLLAAAPGLRVVGRLGAGLDNIDVGALRERGIELVHGGWPRLIARSGPAIGSGTSG